MEGNTMDLSRSYWDGELSPDDYAREVSRRLGTDTPDVQAIVSAVVFEVAEMMRSLLMKVKFLPRGAETE